MGTSVAVVFNPALVPVIALGSTAPDWLESVFNLPVIWHLREQLGWKGQVKHRHQTHILLNWLIPFIISFWLDYHGILFWFALGGIMHWLGDAMTIKGVPLVWWSHTNYHLFGARVRTGQPAEYVIGGLFMATALAIAITWHSTKRNDSAFFPFFYDWAGEYRDGNIDGQEWRENRLKFF